MDGSFRYSWAEFRHHCNAWADGSFGNPSWAAALAPAHGRNRDSEVIVELGAFSSASRIEIFKLPTRMVVLTANAPR